MRNGTVNLFVFVDVRRRWRHVDVTERRTSIDFAEPMRELVDVYYPTVEIIRVVLDNLSTHTPPALSEAFEPEGARRILRRIEDAASPRAEIAAPEKARNDAKATIEPGRPPRSRLSVSCPGL